MNMLCVGSTEEYVVAVFWIRHDNCWRKLITAPGTCFNCRISMKLDDHSHVCRIASLDYTTLSWSSVVAWSGLFASSYHKVVVAFIILHPRYLWIRTQNNVWLLIIAFARILLSSPVCAAFCGGDVGVWLCTSTSILWLSNVEKGRIAE